MRRSERTYGLAASLAMLLVVLFAAPTGGWAQPRYALQPESTMRIAGTATTGNFTCEADDIVGHGRFAADGAAPQAMLAARVRSFDCGKRRMNDDLYEALHSAEHPLIRFTLTGVEDVATPGGGERRLRAAGTLELAGATRRVTVMLAGRRGADGRLYGQGQKALRMTDFGVEPPTALLGLVEVRDRLTVHFDLVAALDPATAHR